MCVSESSVKRWCDCGAISSEKTLGGHRKITLDSLQLFLKHSQRKILFPHELGLPDMLPQREFLLPGKESVLNQEFRECLARGDEDACRKLLHGLVAEGATRSEAVECLVTDAMHGVGEAWRCQQIDVYQERRGCEIAMRLIAEQRQLLPVIDDQAPVAIGGSPEGDPYQLPTALVDLTLREAGWNAVNLGHHLPMKSFHQAVADCQPRLVWMSISVIEDVEAFVIAQNEMADALGADVALVIGGRALNDAVRPRLRYSAYCDSLRHLTEFATMIRSTVR
jgi:methanogenic corrinoid protein MtbC1